MGVNETFSVRENGQFAHRVAHVRFMLSRAEAVNPTRKYLSDPFCSSTAFFSTTEYILAPLLLQYRPPRLR